MSRNVPASVRARLLNVAKAQGADFNQVLVRYALERLLFRMSESAHADRFVLKGALWFTLWYQMPHRATRDADLLGFGASDPSSLAQTFREIAAVAADDGIAFDPASVAVEQIRKDAGHAGVRVTLRGELSGARCRMQIDIGFGDVVTPAPVDAVYPVLLEDLPAPRLRRDDTFTHEIGHLMGGNHTRLQLGSAPVAAIVGNGYPDPFAKLIPGTFASIMSIDFGTPRRLHFSNPNVIVEGVTTGTLGSENNARIVDLLTPAMADFRDRPDLIFAHGFQ